MWHHSGLPQPPPAATGPDGRLPVLRHLGILITSLLIRERNDTGTISMTGFYMRRSLRIFPLYYAVLLLYVALVPVMDQGPAGSEFFRNLPFFATYTSNWFVPFDESERIIFYFAWSLATEEQFYLTWPWDRALRIARRPSPAARPPDRDGGRDALGAAGGDRVAEHLRLHRAVDCRTADPVRRGGGSSAARAARPCRAVAPARPACVGAGAAGAADRAAVHTPRRDGAGICDLRHVDGTGARLRHARGHTAWRESCSFRRWCVWVSSATASTCCTC